MVSAPPKYPMNMEMATSSQPISALLRPLSKRTVQARLPLISLQVDTALVMNLQRRERMSSHIVKWERPGGSNLCCRVLEKETLRSHASSRDCLHRVHVQQNLKLLTSTIQHGRKF